MWLLSMAVLEAIGFGYVFLRSIFGNRIVGEQKHKISVL